MEDEYFLMHFRLPSTLIRHFQSPKMKQLERAFQTWYFQKFRFAIAMFGAVDDKNGAFWKQKIITILLVQVPVLSTCPVQTLHLYSSQSLRKSLKRTMWTKYFQCILDKKTAFNCYLTPQPYGITFKSEKCSHILT